jgi:hypothetical protein
MLVGVQAYKAAFRRNIDIIRIPLGQLGIAAAEAIFEYICHSYQLDGHNFRFDSIAHCPGAATSAANEGKLNGIGFGRMNSRDARG